MSGTQGGNYPNVTFKNRYLADGSVKGDAWDKGQWFTNIKGKWTLNDAGQLCSDLLNDQGNRIAGCGYYFVLGDAHYSSASETRSQAVNERKISR